jgi:outer membrane immunogenic protein
MKNLLLATVALTALAAPAIAADMRAPVYKAPPPVYAYNWTGCYVGGNVGTMWARKDWTNTTPGPLVGRPIGSHNADGFIGGVQGGCNYQFAGGFVIGIQGDYDWTDAKGTNNDLIGIFWTDQTRVRSLASVTGRVGYAWDRFLGYVKGGGAWERDEYSVFLTATGTLQAAASETRGGWTVGFGGEYALTDWLSGFAEYDYYDFGNRGNTFVTPAGGTFGTVDIKERKGVFKIGFNLRWGSGPVVAKY